MARSIHSLAHSLAPSGGRVRLSVAWRRPGISQSIVLTRSAIAAVIAVCSHLASVGRSVDRSVCRSTLFPTPSLYSPFPSRGVRKRDVPGGRRAPTSLLCFSTTQITLPSSHTYINCIQQHNLAEIPPSWTLNLRMGQ